MRFSFRTKIILWTCLIILNIIFRYPTTPHEIGWDSFEIHALANSVSTNGYARWWAHPLSIIGMYPLSYASSVPFILSGISQSTGIEMEKTIWIFNLFIGILTTFSIYILSSLIMQNDIFKFLMAFIYPFSSGILTLTTWTTSTRGFFVILIPIFVYSLIKIRPFSIRYIIITVLLFIFLLATHNMIYFTIPIILSFILLICFFKVKKYIKLENPESVLSVIIFISFVIMFLYPFFSRVLYVNDPELSRFGSGSRYLIFFTMFERYARYFGFLILFALGGYIYLTFKRNKQFNELLILIMMISLAPLLYVPTYMKWFILPFGSLIIGICLVNVIQLSVTHKNKYISYYIIIILISSILFSGFYQFQHFSTESDYSFRYLDEKSYNGGIWVKNYVDKNLFWDNNLIGLRIAAVSGKPVLFGEALSLAYNFSSISDINISKNSPLTTEYYKQGPYVKTLGTADAEGHSNQLSQNEFDSRWGIRLISQYNIYYVIDFKYGDTIFMRSVSESGKQNLFDNGLIKIWRL